MVVLSLVFNAIVVIFVFSVLILVHELGHFIFARLSGVRVEKFALGFGKKLFGVKKNDTEYLINLIPLGGFVKLAGEEPGERKGFDYELQTKSPIKRCGIFAAGSVFNYIFAFILFFFLYCLGTPTLTAKVGSVIPDYPAAKIGIKEGDKILSVNGKTLSYWDDVVKEIRADKNGAMLSIEVLRDGTEMNFKVMPSLINTENIFKQKVTFVGIGIGPGEEVIMLKSNPIKAVGLAAEHVWFFTVATYKGIWFLITGAMPIKENVGGPIRIVEVLTKTIQYGPLSVMSMMATISLALALFNLLPFPILDGGHILFLAIEKIRGKPLSVKTQDMITQVAFVLLMAFVVYVSYFDTARVVMGLRK